MAEHHFDFTNDEYFNQCDFSWLVTKSAAIAPVRNQGHTSSCYAFVVADSISALFYLITGEFRLLCTQQLIDCLWEKYALPQGKKADGCGVFPAGLSLTYRYAKEEGLALEADYPFKGMKEGCKSADIVREGKLKTFINRHEFFGTTKTDDEINVLIKAQPLGAGIQLTDRFKQYKGVGVYDGPTNVPRDQRHLHAVLIVGYGRENGIDYFLIKNSFGEGWGKRGFGKITRGSVIKFGYPVIEP